MSWRANAYVKELRVCPNGESITSLEKLVAFVLADALQDKVGAYTFPSVSNIAVDASVESRHCWRLLDALEVKGVIGRKRGIHPGRGHRTFYRFPALDGYADAGVKASPVQCSLDELEAKSVVCRFPAFDGPCAKPIVETSREGGSTVTLLAPERGDKGGSKEGPARMPILKEQEQERKNKSTSPNPLPTAPTGKECPSRAPDCKGDQAPRYILNPAVRAAVEQVMSSCSFTSKGLESALTRVVCLEMSKGRHPATIALDMIAAWKEQAAKGHLLRVKFGPERFFEDGIWKDANIWFWKNN